MKQKKKVKVVVAASLAIALAGLGAYRTYVPSDADLSDQDLMMAENVLAVTETDDNSMVEIRGSVIGYCWKKDVGRSTCPTPESHGAGCEIVSITFGSTPRPLYCKGKVAMKDFKRGGFVKWKSGDGYCNSVAGHKTTTNAKPANPATYHTYGSGFYRI